jgi:antirestriction protein ArdC
MQAQQPGGQLRRAEVCSREVYADHHTKSETNELGEESAREVAFLMGNIRASDYPTPG